MYNSFNYQFRLLTTDFNFNDVIISQNLWPQERVVWSGGGIDFLLQKSSSRDCPKTCQVFFKWANSRLFFRLFLVFPSKQYNFLQQINVKKCPSSIWRRNLNPGPLEHESSPITTRSRLLPQKTWKVLRRVPRSRYHWRSQ